MIEVSQRKCLGSHREGVWMRLRVQPNARRDEWVGPQGDCIKIRIAAPPVDAAANQRLLSFLSKGLGDPSGHPRSYLSREDRAAERV